MKDSVQGVEELAVQNEELRRSPVRAPSRLTLIAAVCAVGLAWSVDAAAAQAAAPTFSPAPGTYAGTVSVTLSTSTAGATIRYSTDGLTSAVYTGPLTLSATTFVRAVAQAAGLGDSALSSATYTLTATPAVAISISPASTSVASGQARTFTAAVTGTSDTAVTWSVQEASGCGSVAAGVYSAPVTAAALTCHVVARSHADPTRSAVATASVTAAAATQAAAPTFSPAPGTYAGTVSVTLTTTTAGGTIRYSTDGVTSAVYTAPLTLSATTLVRAVTQATGLRDSALSSATYTLTAAPGVAVSISPASTSVASGQSRTFTAAVTGTSDTAVTWSVQEASGCGSVAAGVYSAPVTAVAVTCHVVARSHADPTRSAVATASVTAAAAAQAAAPTFSPAPGTYAGTVSVTLTTTTAGGTIRYSTDGLTSAVYTAPLTLSATTLVRAVTQAAGLRDSALSAATYTLTAAPGVAVSISPTSTSVVGGQARTFTATVTGSTDTAVTWSLQEASGCGSVAAGVYAAPVTAAALTCHVVASSHADPTRSAVAAVAVAVTPQAAAPTFSPAAGTFATTLSVALASATAGATIRYSIDGSTPTSLSSAYAGALTLSATTTVRALAQAAGLRDSALSSATFTLSATPVVAVSLSPATYAAVSAELVAFSATVTGTADTAVSWSVLEASGCGTVTAGGAWSAPTVTGVVTCHVVATSHADATATARATITVTDSLDPSLAILAGRALYFGHQSVGAQITQGVQRILDASAGPKPTHASVGTPPQAGDMTVGRWNEGYLGTNFEPLTKIADFQAAMLGAAGQALNALGAGKGLAYMKLCFVDVQGSWYQSHGDADLFAAYQAMVSAVKAQRPNVHLVHVTMPLCSDDTADNARREAYNGRLRAAFGDQVFDLALVESTDPDGNRVTGAYGPRAYAGYTIDDHCHLDDDGQNRVARALVQFLAR